ncbi:hypothetical protein [Rossellomorea marisflavi]|uniref:hypothetical protein n=1 Tax=Rossellomorea marisflavi TaxID=189381 RepID=UPI003FA0B15E
MESESLTLSSPKSVVQRRPADSVGNRVWERSRRHEEARTTPLGKRVAAAKRNDPIFPLIHSNYKKGCPWTESLTLSSPKSAVQRRPTDSEGNRVRERSRRHEEARTTPLGKRTAAAERNGHISSPHFSIKTRRGEHATRITHLIFTKECSAAEAGRLRRE